MMTTDRLPTLCITIWALVLTFILGASSLRAQPADSVLIQGKRLLERGYNAGDTDQLREARALFERATQAGEHEALAHYYAGLASQRIVDVSGSQMEDEQQLEVLDAAIEHLKAAKEQDDAFAEAYALLANLYGRKMGIKPQLGMLLGPRTSRLMKQAHELGPDNPRVVLTQAISDFFTPESWGGDKQKAMDTFHRATELFAEETVADPIQPDWGHSEAYAWLGLAHMQEGKYAAAEQALTHALEVNPDFGWVKEGLLPQLEELRGNAESSDAEGSGRR